MTEKREPADQPPREGAQPAPSSGIKEALGALTRALSSAGADVRREVAAELGAAAREVRDELGAAGREVAADLGDAARELKEDLTATGRDFAEAGAELGEARREFSAAAREVRVELAGAGAELADAVRSVRPKRDARSAKAERTRADLLAAARKVFAEHGYEGASVADLAKAAGYTKGALYAHFASKEDLFVAVVRAEVAGQDEVQTPEELEARPDPSQADIANVLLGLETYLFVHRHPDRRDEVSGAVGGTLDGLARGVHAMRTGSSGDPELMDVRLAFGLSALHSYAAIVAPLVPDLDIDATVEWLEERLAGDL